MVTYWCLAICRYGYRGFYDRDDKPVVLTRRSVDGIQLQGGTILGTSRGGADIKWGTQTLHSILWMVCRQAGRPHSTACDCAWLWSTGILPTPIGCHLVCAGAS